MLIGISGKIGSGKDTVANMLQYLTMYRTNEEVKNFLEYNSTHIYFGYYQVVKFAGKLKEIVSLLIGCTISQLEDQQFKSTPLSTEWSIFKISNFGKPYNRLSFTTEMEAQRFCLSSSNSQHSFTYQEEKMTPRKLLQLIGTEGGRDLIHPNVWVNSLFAHYNCLAYIWNKGSYRNTCFHCKESFLGAKLQRVCEKCCNTIRNNDKWIITDCRFPNEAEAIKSRNGILIRIERPSLNHLSNHESETALDSYKKFDHTIINDGNLEDLFNKVKKLYEDSIRNL